MGQKINPIGFRLGINRTWDSRWYANTGEYGKLLHEDIKIRDYLEKELKQAAISKVVIERPHKKCRVTIHAARPGLIIGKKGADIEKLRKKLTEMTQSETHLNIVEVRKPETDATLVAQSIAQQLERRIAFRRAMKRAVQSAMRLGAEGIRINCSGRLGGAEIARMEWYREGRVPLHTLRADVDYGKLLHEDLKIREYLEKELKQAAISKSVIERPHKKCRVTIHAARPGLIIGKKGADLE
jgi:small subunit ribosomal protein S3